MADLSLPKLQSPVVTLSSGVAPGGARGSSTSKGAEVALRSLDHLATIEREGGSSTLQKGVVAAMLGFALHGAVSPAHADTTAVKAPQGRELYLDGHTAGAPDYAKLLGTTTFHAPADTVDARTKAAFDRFEARFTQIIHRDAGSLAAGLRPLQNGDSFDATQQKDLERALGDLVKELPVAAFADDFQSALKTALGGRDLSNARLGDLGKIGGDAAKDLVKKLKQDHPKAYWSIAGTVAAAAVTVGYTQGTDALAKLGIKPEISTQVFKDVKVKLGVEAGPRFSDPRVSVGLEGQHTFDGGSVIKGGVAAQIHNKAVVSAEVNGSFASTNGRNVDARVRLDGTGKPFDARLSASQSFTHDVGGGGNGVLYGQALWSNGTNGTVVQSSLSLGMGAAHGRWTSSVTTGYDFRREAFTASLATGRTYDVVTKNDLDVQFRARLDSKGDALVGFGVAFRF